MELSSCGLSLLFGESNNGININLQLITSSIYHHLELFPDKNVVVLLVDQNKAAFLDRFPVLLRPRIVIIDQFDNTNDLVSKVCAVFPHQCSSFVVFSLSELIIFHGWDAAFSLLALVSSFMDQYSNDSNDVAIGAFVISSTLHSAQELMKLQAFVTNGSLQFYHQLSGPFSNNSYRKSSHPVFLHYVHLCLEDPKFEDPWIVVELKSIRLSRQTGKTTETQQYFTLEPMSLDASRMSYQLCARQPQSVSSASFLTSSTQASSLSSTTTSITSSTTSNTVTKATPSNQVEQLGKTSDNNGKTLHSIPNLVTFDSTDPEFDEDECPDDDLDL